MRSMLCTIAQSTDIAPCHLVMTWLKMLTETGGTSVHEAIWTTQKRDALTLVTELDLNHRA